MLPIAGLFWSTFAMIRSVFRTPRAPRSLFRPSAVLLGVAVLAGAAATFISAPAAIAAPEPDAIPTRWQLDVESGPLRLASVEVAGEGIKFFYYFTFKVTNNTGDDQLLAPKFELSTDEGEIRRSDRDVAPAVTETLLARLRNPYLEDQIAIQGRILEGPENAREGLVVWPCTNLSIDEVNIYAEGFSGESKSVVAPDSGKTFVLRKTLMLRHEIAGNLNPRSDAPLERAEMRWVMR